MSALRVAAAAAFFAAGAAQAADVNVIIYSDVRPGNYGRVDFGGGPRPPLVYTNPILVAPPPRRAPAPEPLYLHVPPGHAKSWNKHCRKYDACNRPVYFVMSDEYKPKKAKKPKKDKD
ncbi:MAG TPA: hypothetical protein VM122_09240 [Usitatibacter sp.]|nr:hypothetical protein [Usitatibacter sp.]